MHGLSKYVDVAGKIDHAVSPNIVPPYDGSTSMPRRSRYQSRSAGASSALMKTPPIPTTFPSPFSLSKREHRGRAARDDAGCIVTEGLREHSLRRRRERGLALLDFFLDGRLRRARHHGDVRDAVALELRV